MNQVCRKLGVSKRRACKALGQARSTQRYECKQSQKDRLIIKDMLKSSKEHRRYGYRRITIQLRKDGCVNGGAKVSHLAGGLKVYHCN